MIIMKVIKINKKIKSFIYNIILNACLCIMIKTFKNKKIESRVLSNPFK